MERLQNTEIQLKKYQQKSNEDTTNGSSGFTIVERSIFYEIIDRSYFGSFCFFVTSFRNNGQLLLWSLLVGSVMLLSRLASAYGIIGY
ncbi:MAG TPA: hypothetical protein VK369_12185 [Segetibacter sp.]|nr:hypothetical protein [Segetibacter sp.]